MGVTGMAVASMFMNRLVLLLVFSLSIAISVSAKAWNDISPLKTKRFEVTQRFGQPSENEVDGRAIFLINGETVTISWILSDCYGNGSMVKESVAGPDALVYQITVEPIAPIMSISEDPESQPAVANKAELKAAYRRWLSPDVSCTKGREEEGWFCSLFNDQTGYGYSSSKLGVTALYYFPTKEEDQTFVSSRHRCVERL